MSDLLKSTKAEKSPKVKKTLGDLLGEGQVKTGSAVLAEKTQKAKEAELFLAAAREEARMRRFAAKKER